MQLFKTKVQECLQIFSMFPEDKQLISGGSNTYLGPYTVSIGEASVFNEVAVKGQLKRKELIQKGGKLGEGGRNPMELQ